VIAAAYAYLLASAGPQEARWMASLTFQAWKHRIIAGAALHNCGTLQGVDALRSILYLEPGLPAEIEAMVDDLIDFARRELTSAAHWNTPSAPAQAGVQPLPEIPTVLNGGCIKPLQWKPPNAEQLSDEGKTRLAALQQEYPKIEDTWWLLNGRRTAAEVCARSPHDPQAVLSYLSLLLAEARIQLLITGE
jgi:hypothetical protein